MANAKPNVPISNAQFPKKYTSLLHMSVVSLNSIKQSLIF